MDFAAIWANIQRHKKHDFLITPDYQLRYKDLANLVNRLLGLMDTYKILPASRIIILTQNEGAAVISFIAALLEGIIPVMLTPDTPQRRVAAIVNATEPMLVILDDSRQHEEWVAQIPTRVIVQTINHAPKSRLFSLAGKDPATCCGLDLPMRLREPGLPPVNDDLAYILYTSGTTQTSSGVMISRKNLIANLKTLSRLFDCNTNTRLFNDMVLAHGDGLVQGPLLAVANTAALIRSGGFAINHLEAWLNRVHQQKATHFITVPTVWSLIDQYALHDDYFDSHACTHLISVAAKLEKALWQRLQNRFHQSISNQYGLTETVASALYAGEAHPEMGRFNSIGKPVDCEARIGEQGELQLRGDNIFLGYWKDPQRTREAFTSDGWMKTGDIAQVSADGSYEILGRLKTIIMTGGFLIRPEEIDEVLLTHPAIREAVTVAMPDPNFTEIPMSAVILKAGYADIDENTLLSYARANLEARKVPKRIILLDFIPRGDAGKPQLSALREILQNMLKQDAEPVDQGNNRDISGEVYQIAARVLRIDPKLLQADASPASVRSWDSFSQVALMMAMEDHFAVRIPVAKAASIRNLGEFVTIIKDLLKLK